MNIRIPSIAFIFSTILSIVSCTNKQQNQDNIVKKNIEEYLNSEMKYNDNYEFIKIEMTDSVLFSDNIEYEKEWFRRDSIYNKNALDNMKSYKANFPTISEDELVKMTKADIEETELILSKIDSLEVKLGDRKNDVASYTYALSIRVDNFGLEKTLKEYIVQTGPAPDFKIINIAKDKDEIYETPNDFPGFREILKKNIK